MVRNAVKGQVGWPGRETGARTSGRIRGSARILGSLKGNGAVWHSLFNALFYFFFHFSFFFFFFFLALLDNSLPLSLKFPDSGWIFAGIFKRCCCRCRKPPCRLPSTVAGNGIFSRIRSKISRMALLKPFFSNLGLKFSEKAESFLDLNLKFRFSKVWFWFSFVSVVFGLLLSLLMGALCLGSFL